MGKLLVKSGLLIAWHHMQPFERQSAEIAVHIFNPSTLEVEAGGFLFEASLVCLAHSGDRKREEGRKKAQSHVLLRDFRALLSRKGKTQRRNNKGNISFNGCTLV